MNQIDYLRTVQSDDPKHRLLIELKVVFKQKNLNKLTGREDPVDFFSVIKNTFIN
jgi:hypothetical protein